MDIPKLLFSLREGVSCPVCQDILKDPRYLPCLHSFCLHCLINWHRASGGQVDLSCPKCQGRSRVPASGDLKDLPTSFFLSGFIDALAIKEVEAQKIEIAGLIQTPRDNLHAKMKIVAHIDEDYAQLVQRSKDMLRDVDVFVDSLMSRLQEERQNIKSAVEIETKKSLESLTTKKIAIKEEMKEIESALEKAEKLLTQSTDAEVVQLKKPLQTTLERVGQVEPVERDPESLFEIVFMENNKILETINRGGIGLLKFLSATDASKSVAEGKGLCKGTVGREAQFNLTTRNAAAEQCYNKKDNVTVDLRAERGQECLTTFVVNDNIDGTYKISYSSTFGGKCNLSVKVNGHHIRGSPFSVLIKSFNVKPILSFGKYGVNDGMFIRPWGLSVNSRDEIAVTSNHKVQIFDCKGIFLRSFGREGSDKGQLYFPKGIAFGKDGNIYVLDSGNHRIQIFNEEGRYMSMFGGEGSLDSQLMNPWGLSLDSKGNILVSDWGNKFIKIFSPDGKFLTKIGGPSSLSGPTHCVQSGDYLIVLDFGDYNVKVFTWEGYYKYHFGTRETGNGGFNRPYCLSVTKSGHLLVGFWGNDRVQVFELNGNLVGKFGKQGSNVGEFKNPSSVALLSNGQIVVSEYGNDRIQIFD